MKRGRGEGTWKGANNGAHDLRGVPGERTDFKCFQRLTFTFLSLITMPISRTFLGTKNISCYDTTSRVENIYIYIYIAQCNSCVEWIGNGCRICTFRLYGLFFDQRKMGKEKRKRKRSLKIIDDRPTEEENFFGRFKSQAVLISRVPSRR